MRMRTCLMSGAAVLALSATSQAAVLFDVDFNDIVVGATPPSVAATSGGTTTQLSGRAPSSGTSALHAWGQTGALAGSSFGDGNFLELWDEVTTSNVSNVASVKFKLNSADVVSTTSTDKIVTISWDMIMDDLEGAAGNIFLNFRGGPAVSGILIKSTGQLRVDNNIVETLAFGQSYSMKVELNYDTGVVSFWNGDVAPKYTGSFDTAKSFQQFDASTSTTGQAAFGIDNVKIETFAVPEPASMALLGLGGLAMLSSRKR